MKSTKKGFSLVELGIVVAIITVIIGIIAVNGYNLYQNSIDTKIQQNLKSLTDATQLFMVDSNGIVPCFTPKAKEGHKPADGICQDKYDYYQGKTTTDVNIDLDFDSDKGEEFTFQNILAPSYIASIPREGRNGQNYFFTRGKNDTVQGQTSYAYSAPLAGNKAGDKLLNNTSIFNVVNATDFPEATEIACTASDIKYDISTTEAGASGVEYKVFTGLKKDTGITESTACDVYSEWLNVVTNAFDTNDDIISISVQPVK